MDSSELKSGLNDLKLRLIDIREGVFDVTSKENRLKQIEDDLAKEEVWSDLELSQKISKEKTTIEKSLASFKSVEEKVSDGLMFIDIAEEEGDEVSIKEIIESFHEIEKLVLASTSSIYGNSGSNKMVEGIDEKIEPPSIYAASKLSGEVFAKNILEDTDSNVIITRFFTVYGPWGRPDMALFKFTKAILEGKPIDVFNHGNHTRDFTYIDDIIEGIVRVIDKPAKPNRNWDSKVQLKRENKVQIEKGKKSPNRKGE